MSYAGPSASRVGASAVVARLRRSADWSSRRLAKLSTLSEASATVAASRTVVVDRRGLIRRVGAVLDRFEDTRTPMVLAVEAVVLRALAKSATGIWDVSSGCSVLVAPNVLADAQRYALDQTDWCRWVSLCTGLRGVHLTHAPHLVTYVADLVRALPERSDELVRIVLLLDALPTAEMEVLTPRDLPSIHWLRTHRAQAGGVGLVRACAAAGMPQELINAVFSDDVLKKRHNSEPITINDNTVWVVRVKEVREERTAPFAEVKDDVRAAYLRSEAVKLAEKKARAALADLQAGKKTELQWSPVTKLTAEQARQSMPPEAYSELAKARPSKDKPAYVMLQGLPAPVIVEVQAVTPPENVAQQIPAAKQLLMQQQVNSTFNNLLRYLSKNIGRKEGGQKINAASE